VSDAERFVCQVAAGHQDRTGHPYPAARLVVCGTEVSARCSVCGWSATAEVVEGDGE